MSQKVDAISLKLEGNPNSAADAEFDEEVKALGNYNKPYSNT